MYVIRNIEARSCNRCCNGKAILNTQPECVFVVLYTGCSRRKVPDFGRVFLMLKYTDITQNTYCISKVERLRR